MFVPLKESTGTSAEWWGTFLGKARMEREQEEGVGWKEGFIPGAFGL